MKEVNYVFGALEERDVETLMRIGTQQQLHVNDQLLTQGNHHDAIYLVLDGELSVSVKSRNGAIAYVGKGEIVGEMSLLESQPASATPCAITPVTVLRIPRDALGENLAADPGFNMRFYRALGMLLSHRLRTTAHAHLNLLGWVSLFLIGTYYRLNPAVERSTSATLQVWTWIAGTLVLTAGVALVFTGLPGGDPIAAIGSFIVLVAALWFGWIVTDERGLENLQS